MGNLRHYVFIANMSILSVLSIVPITNLSAMRASTATRKCPGSHELGRRVLAAFCRCALAVKWSQLRVFACAKSVGLRGRSPEVPAVPAVVTRVLGFLSGYLLRTRRRK